MGLGTISELSTLPAQPTVDILEEEHGVRSLLLCKVTLMNKRYSLQAQL